MTRSFAGPVGAGQCSPAALIPVLGTIQQYTPGSAGGSLVAALGAATQGAEGGAPGIQAALDGPTATAVLLAYLVFFVAATLAVTRRRDVE